MRNMNILSFFMFKTHDELIVKCINQNFRKPAASGGFPIPAIFIFKSPL